MIKILKQISNDNNIDSNSIEMEYLNMIDYVFEQFGHTEEKDMIIIEKAVEKMVDQGMGRRRRRRA